MSQHSMPPDHTPDHDAQWEASVKRMAADMLYPPTPDIAAKVRQRLERPHAPARLRFAQAAAIFVLLLAALMAVPQVRAEVSRFLQIGVIRIFFGDPTPSPTPASFIPSLGHTPRPPSTTNPVILQSVLELPGETTLDAARDAVSFEIALPTYPADLGDPDHVFVLQANGQIAVLVWLSLEDPTTPMLSLFYFSPNNDVWKTGVSGTRELEIDGQHALWTESPHRIEFETREGTMYRIVEDTVLIWFSHPVTYRVEGADSLEEAVKIIESLSPGQ